MTKPTTDQGVYRLAAAVLLQAIQDATSVSMGRRASAIRWINSNQEGGYTFLFVCRALSRDPEAVRQFCRREIARRRLPEARWHPVPELAPSDPSGHFIPAA